jgi:ComF family protein
MLKSLVDLLFPKGCSGCNEILQEGEAVVCIACRHDIPFTRHHLNPDNETYRKFHARLPLQHASSLLYFQKEGMVQQLIHNLKYRGQKDVGKLMGEWYSYDLKDVSELKDVDFVIPVPLHIRKLRERGYNQVAGFGKTVAEGLNCTYSEDILQRVTYNKTQTKKNLADRAAIIGSAFDVVSAEMHQGKHFLLVDDVITTGATLEACGKALLKIPGAKLSIVTIAYAQ